MEFTCAFGMSHLEVSIMGVVLRASREVAASSGAFCTHNWLIRSSIFNLSGFPACPRQDLCT